MPEIENPDNNIKGYKGTGSPLPNLNRKKIIIISTFLLGLIILFPIISLVVASYFSIKLPLVSKSFQRKVDYTIASIPFIPKNPKQIITKALQDNQNVKTASEVFTFGLESGDKSLLSLQVKSKVDSEEESNVSLEADIQGEIGQNKGAKLDLSVKQIGDYLFFNIKQAPTLPGYDFSTISGNWYKINLEKASSSIGTTTLKDTSIKEDIAEKSEEVYDFFDENHLFGRIRKISGEKINGENNFHLQLPLDTKILTRLINELNPGQKTEEKEIDSLIKDLTFDIWVGEKSFFINKFEIAASVHDIISGELLTPAAENKLLALKITFDFTDINKKVKVVAPSKVKEINSFFELLFLLQPKTINIPEEVLGVSSPQAEFGSNLLFYERMLHVITLLHKSL